ncbi:ABC transporter permease [Fibrella arboris]|uniref:ABC transporter permease n=1 Tax=Fibrella arboris TaxID=3242486 RepID=UPI003521CDA5
MLHSYLTLALRSLWRNKVYTLLNVSGIAIGLAAVTLIYWQVSQINSFDSQHPHADRLYRLSETLPPNHEPGSSTVTPLLPTLLRESPAVETGTRLVSWQTNWITYLNRDEQQAIFHADTSVFSVFHFPLKLGNPRTALAEPTAMVISEKVADKLFPGENPMDKTVTLDNGRAYVIRGVIGPRPANSAIHAEVLIPFADRLATNQPATENWYNGNCQTYVRLRPDADPSVFEQSMKAFVATHYAGEGRNRKLTLLPVRQLLRKDAGALLTVIIYGLVFIAAFILLIVAINFLNLSSALSLARSGEVALRTTLGAGAGQILSQFVLEAVLVAAVGALLGTLLLKALLPVYIDFFDIDTMFSPQLPLSTSLFLVGVVLVLGTLAGWLPGRYLTRQKVVTALQGKTTVGNRTRFRSMLVVVQFTLATIMIACTGVMITQNAFIKGQQTGFRQDDIVVVDLDRAYRHSTSAELAVDNLIGRLRQNPAVLDLSATATVPGKYWLNKNTYTDLTVNRDVLFEQQAVDETFLSTFGISLLAGRSLLAADTAANNVVINETGAKTLGYKTVGEAVGKVLKPHGGGSPFMIVGVFRDYYKRGVHHAIEPMLFWSSGPARLRNNNWLSVRVKPGTAPALLADLERQFQAIPARKPFRYVYLSDDYNQVYTVMAQSQVFLTGMALITVLLACAGIFGLSLFSIRQRTREIGLRKVLGASVGSIVWLLSQRTVRLVGIAVVIASPMAWWMMNQWLNTFVLHIAFPWWVMACSGTLALVVAMLTVSSQSIRAAIANPVDSLRSE